MMRLYNSRYNPKCSITICLSRIPLYNNNSVDLWLLLGGGTRERLPLFCWSVERKGGHTLFWVCSEARTKSASSFPLTPTYSSTFGELGTNPMSRELLRNMCTQKQYTSAKGSCTGLVISLLINQHSTAKILCHSVPKALLLSGEFILTSREGGAAVKKGR